MERRQQDLDIRLRPGVVFHDGTPMDAEAVKFTLEWHLTMRARSAAVRSAH
jgi:peptide/nickel transport system substrate-binding protein